jgi:hypothetical protein
MSAYGLKSAFTGAETPLSEGGNWDGVGDGTGTGQYVFLDIGIFVASDNSMIKNADKARAVAVAGTQGYAAWTPESLDMTKRVKIGADLTGYAGANTASTDQVGIFILGSSGSVSDGYGVTIRDNGTTGAAYFACLRKLTGSSTFGNLGEFSLGATATAFVELEIYGDYVIMYVNGVERVRWRDDDYRYATAYGVIAASCDPLSGATFSTVDNFNLGTLADITEERHISLPGGQSGFATVAAGASAWANTAWVELVGSHPFGLALERVDFYPQVASATYLVNTTYEMEIVIGIGAPGSEVEKVVIPCSWRINDRTGHCEITLPPNLPEPYEIPAFTRVAVRTRQSVASAPGIQALKGMFKEVVPAGVVTTPLTLAATLVLTPLVARQMKPLPKAVTLTLTPAVSRRVYVPENVAASLTAQVSQVKKSLVPLSASIPLVPAQIRKRLIPLSGGLTDVGAVVRKMYVAEAASLPLANALAKKVSRQESASLSTSPVMLFTKTAPRSLAASLALTSNVAMRRTGLIALGAGLPLIITEADIVQHYLTLNGGLVVTPALVKEPSRTMAANLIETAALAKKVSRLMALTVSMNPAMTIRKTAPRSLAANLPLAADMIRLKLPTAIPLAAGLSLASAITKEPSRQLAITLALAAELNKEPSRTMATGLPLTTALLREKQLLLVALLPMGQNMTFLKLAGLFPISLSASLVLVPTLAKVKTAPRQLSSTVALSAALTRLLWRDMAAGIPLDAAILREFDKTMAVNLQLFNELAFQRLGGEIAMDVTLNLTATLLELIQRFRDGLISSGLSPAVLLAAGAEPATLFGSAPSEGSLHEVHEEVPELSIKPVSIPHITEVR